MKAYIAAGFFNELQLKELNLIEQACKLEGVEVYSPMREAVVKPDESQENQKTVFNSNLMAIESCDLVIANTRDKDIGTMFECGYAYAKSKPILYFFADAGKFKFNLMLAQSGLAVVDDFSNLRRVLVRLIYNIYYHEPYEGIIQ